MDLLIPMTGLYCIDCEALDRLELFNTEELLATLQNESLAGRGYSVVSDVAIVSVCGVLSKYMNSLTKLVGGTALVHLENEINEAAADPGVSGICMVFNSPGGSCCGVDRVARAIQKARETKPVVASITGSCCGTAYEVASQCDVVFGNDGCVVGALGVQIVEAYPTWCVLGVESNSTPADGMVIFRPGHEPSQQFHRGLTDSDLCAIAEWQETVETGITSRRPQVDRAMLSQLARGVVVNAEQAQAGGFIDGVVPHDAVVDRIRRSDQSIRGGVER